MRRLASTFGLHLLRLNNSHKQVFFADNAFRSLGRVKISLRTPSVVPSVFLTFDIVTADVPALRGMDVTDAENLIVDIFSNQLRKILVLQNVERKNGTQIDHFVILE